MPQGYISIGSNIDKEAHIPCCLNTLNKIFGPLTLSSIYESEAVGFVGNTFHNLVVGFSSDLDAREVARILRQIELEHGRSRQSQKSSSYFKFYKTKLSKMDAKKSNYLTSCINFLIIGEIAIRNTPATKA